MGCCNSESLHSLEEARSSETAKRAFIRAWVNHVTEGARKPKPKGCEREITPQEANTYLVSLRSNIDNLIDDAIVLFDRERYQRAGFLALVAKEELVKMGWFSFENMNRESPIFTFPVLNAEPGFNFRRLRLSYQGLRFHWDGHPSGWKGTFELKDEDVKMSDHDQKIKMAMYPSNFMVGFPGVQIMDLDHFAKYYYLYSEEENMISYLRYVDLDFHHGNLITPWALMNKQSAFDRICFAAALCHDWGHHGGFLGTQGKPTDPHQLRDFLNQTKARYDSFVATHHGIGSDVFPDPTLTENEKDWLRENANY